ncbi:hypothetical protein FKM82_003851 [Ascaphus truei]
MGFLRSFARLDGVLCRPVECRTWLGRRETEEEEEFRNQSHHDHMIAMCPARKGLKQQSTLIINCIYIFWHFLFFYTYPFRRYIRV